MESWKCPYCDRWIGPMEVHEDCARKQDEKRNKERADRTRGSIPQTSCNFGRAAWDRRP